MKKLMLAVCLLFGGATLVSAQEADPSATPSQSQPTDDQDQNKGQQISVSQLPEAVTAKLESQDYSGWTIGDAYKKTDDTQASKEIYTVELKKGTETKSVRFDKEGNEMADANDNQGQSHDQGQPSDQKSEKQ